MIFKGSMVALVTPFYKDTVDTNTLQELVAWHVEQGTEAIVIAGSTGESLLLSEEERITAIKAAVKSRQESGNKIKIIANVGAPGTREAVRMAQDAKDCGVDGIMIITPCYVKPTQAESLEHFKTVVHSVKLPTIIYNHPFRTGTALQVQTLVDLCSAVDLIDAIKDSSNNLDFIAQLRLQLPEKVGIVSGDDSINIGFLAHGACGIISVTANVFPKLCKQFMDAWKNGDCKRAFDIHQKLMPVHKAMFCEPNPCPAKFALFKMGKIKNEVKRPLLPIDENSKSAEIILESMQGL
ncbi:MAG: 4-hydroxy-tetrahydrodipicolinate synthase [Holosporales bacterium]|jgi:4-hydroxy-tetrahydrodipicolinate synthase|nr:4-hydroxy-tetrahydrodipicolinate synthase [Holosporales bacterium]